jgi:ppGpp synthetase/RelA/SpoT-type nucleotidyltranferase/8-oxo-dGTP pyrophosphatase MutT (NUDIX family)
MTDPPYWTAEEQRAIREIAPIVGQAELRRWLEQYHAAYQEWKPACTELGGLLARLLHPLEEIHGCRIEKIDARVKGFTSLVLGAHTKLIEEGASTSFTWTYAVKRLGDIIGARIIGLNLGDVVRIVRRVLSSESFVWERSQIADYYKRAKRSRYRSWQIQLMWKRGTTKTDQAVEIQVRSILEHAWAEWEHKLFYKAPEGASLEAWAFLKRQFEDQKKEIADTLFELAKGTDRIRDIIELTRHRLPTNLNPNRYANTAAVPPALVERLGSPPFGTRILAANVAAGLTPAQVYVEWLSERFVGLELAEPDGEDRAAPHAEDRQRFDLGALGPGLRLRLDGVDARVASYLNRRGFPARAQELLQLCYRRKRDTAHRTFFNEYQARLDDFDCNRGEGAFGATWLRLVISKTNFAYEVSTTYMLEARRVIAPVAKQRAEDPEVEECKKAITDILNSKPFEKERHAANPIGVHVNLICWGEPGPDAAPRTIVVMRRAGKAALHQFAWSTSASGVMVPRKDSVEAAGDIPGLVYDEEKADGEMPSVFRAAQRELEEELGISVPVDHIRILALLRDDETGQPIVVAEAHTDARLVDRDRLFEIAPENWEVDRWIELPLSSEGLARLVKGDSATHVTPSMPPIAQTGATDGPRGVGEFWQPRSAAAVLLSYCRHLGGQVVLDALGRGL